MNENHGSKKKGRVNHVSCFIDHDDLSVIKFGADYTTLGFNCLTVSDTLQLGRAEESLLLNYIPTESDGD